MIRLAHPVIALAAQLALFGLFGNWWLGVIAALCLYAWRERLGSLRFGHLMKIHPHHPDFRESL